VLLRCVLRIAPPMTSVTAIIPVFNRAAMVNRAIDSVLGQELSPEVKLDIIMVDDGSSDPLQKVLSNYGTRVVCIRHSRNRGAAAARNTGIKAAKGEYVAFLDSDDVWLPHKTALQLSEMRAKRWVASCTAYFLCQPSGSERISPLYTAPTLDISDLVWGCFVSPGSTLICLRSVFADIGLFDTALRRVEDWDWLLRFAQHYVLGFIAQPSARIEASEHRSRVSDISNALDLIRSKHLSAVSERNQKHLLAAIDLERAAAFYRSGFRLAALTALTRSILRSPLQHPALAAVLHNKTSGFFCPGSNGTKPIHRRLAGAPNRRSHLDRR
jgi:glycosyltransferase involved in cell wall biosynthesis